MATLHGWAAWPTASGERPFLSSVVAQEPVC
jgi:hypothetical protein